MLRRVLEVHDPPCRAGPGLCPCPGVGLRAKKRAETRTSGNATRRPAAPVGGAAHVSGRPSPTLGLQRNSVPVPESPRRGFGPRLSHAQEQSGGHEQGQRPARKRTSPSPPLGVTAEPILGLVENQWTPSGSRARLGPARTERPRGPHAALAANHAELSPEREGHRGVATPPRPQRGVWATSLGNPIRRDPTGRGGKQRCAVHSLPPRPRRTRGPAHGIRPRDLRAPRAVQLRPPVPPPPPRSAPAPTTPPPRSPPTQSCGAAREPGTARVRAGRAASSSRHAPFPRAGLVVSMTTT